MGRHCPSCSYNSTPPVANPEASTSTLKGSSSVGSASIGGFKSLVQISSNTRYSSDSHFHGALPVSFVSGLTILLYPRTKRHNQFSMLRNCRSSFLLVRTGHMAMADDFFRSTFSSPFPSTCPKNVTDSTLNSHFSGFR